MMQNFLQTFNLHSISDWFYFLWSVITALFLMYLLWDILYPQCVSCQKRFWVSHTDCRIVSGSGPETCEIARHCATCIKKSNEV